MFFLDVIFIFKDFFDLSIKLNFLRLRKMRLKWGLILSIITQNFWASKAKDLRPLKNNFLRLKLLYKPKCTLESIQKLTAKFKIKTTKNLPGNHLKKTL